MMMMLVLLLQNKAEQIPELVGQTGCGVWLNKPRVLFT
jgi:hypothetical protein